MYLACFETSYTCCWELEYEKPHKEFLFVICERNLYEKFIYISLFSVWMLKIFIVGDMNMNSCCGCHVCVRMWVTNSNSSHMRFFLLVVEENFFYCLSEFIKIFAILFLYKWWVNHSIRKARALNLDLHRFRKIF